MNFATLNGLINQNVHKMKQPNYGLNKIQAVLKLKNYLCLGIILLNIQLFSQTCPTAISPITKTFSFGNCGESSEEDISSGDIAQLDLLGGKKYTFQICAINDDGVSPHFQLVDAANVLISSAAGTSSTCAELTYEPCVDESIFMQVFSHSCIANWHSWLLKTEISCCELICADDVHLSASTASCTAPSFLIPSPSFEGPCVAGTVSFSSNPVLTLGALTAAGQEVLTGTAIGVYQVIWKIEDCAGNESMCEQIVIVDPIVACNDLVNINIGGTCTSLSPDMVMEGIPDACLADYTVEVFLGGESIGDEICCVHVGQTLTFEATHTPTGTSCGGNILVEDKQAPNIICSNTIQKCGADLDPSIIGLPNYFDNCETAEPTYIDQFVDFNCTDLTYVGRIDRQWTVTDNQGNSSTCTQEILLERPDITMVVFPDDINIECSDGPFDLEKTGRPLFMDMPLDHQCTLIEYTNDDTITICDYSIKIIREWIVIDWCTNVERSDIQTIKIEDTIGPTITCPDDKTFGTDPNVDCAGTVILEQILARDNCSNTITYDAIWEFGSGFGTYNNVPVGTHEVTYLATDDCGNSTACVAEITVEDDDKPIAICDQFTQISIPSNGTGTLCAEDLDSGSNDNCSMISMEIAMMSDNVFSPCLEYDCTDAGRTDTLILKVEDSNGMSNYCMVQVEIVDKVPPSINCAPDITIDCTSDINDLNLTGQTSAYDACLDTLFYEDEGTLNECSSGTIIRTWQAEDSFGNTSTCEQSISIVDSTPPIITFGNDTTLICEGIDEDFGKPTVEDDCSQYFAGFIDDYLLNDPCVQKLVRTWTVINECTEEEYSKAILIKLFNDDQPPIFTGAPQEITANCEDPVPDFIPPSISDVCDEDLIIEVMDVAGSQAVCEDEFSRRRKWTATDDCGNVGEFIQTIMIIDDSDPVITNAPLDLNLSCNDPIPFDEPMVSDNCDPTVVLIFDESTETGSCSENRTITRTWTATDRCGNSSQVQQVINIADNEDPVFLNFPIDLTLDCGDPIPDAALQVSDNCDNNVAVDFNEEITDGACADEREIKRTWTISDDCGNQVSRTQTINIVDEIGPILNINSFNPDVTIDCNDPLPPINVIFQDNCDNLFTVTEKVDSVGVPCEYEITRTFTATDRCGNSSTAVQKVLSKDTSPPIAFDRPQFLIEDETFTCEKQINVRDIEFLDNCDDVIDVYFEIDYYYDGKIYDSPHPTPPDPIIYNDTTIIGLNPSGIYPLGKHRVTYFGTDDCGNVKEEILEIELVDEVSPLIGCVPVIFSLNQNGMLTLSPTQVVNLDVTYDFCTEIDIQFADQINFDSFTMLGYELDFDCNDLGPNFRVIAAIDEFGNASSCRNQIIITDDSLACGSRPKELVASGRIYTEDNIGMNDVAVELGMDNQGEYYTEVDGFYHFMHLGLNSDCSITPSYDKNHLEGVTTYDLVLMSQHILGVQALDSPYKMIAADINQSGTITTIDLVILRQLILYQIESLPNNTSWRFIDADFQFTDDANPFQDNFNESHLCYDIQQHDPNINFIAVKIGDVNNSALGTINSSAPSQRIESVVNLEIGNPKMKKGKLYKIPFNIDTDLTLSALQFTFKIDESCQLEKVLSEDFYHCLNYDLEKGLVHFAWTNYDANDDKLFEIEVNSQVKSTFFDFLSYDDNYLKAVAFGENGQEYPITILESKGNFETTKHSILASNLIVKQNTPNPFKDNTIIKLELKKASKVYFELYNSQGIMIKSFSNDYTKGKHEIEIRKKDLPSGIYYYKVKTAKEEYMYKMLMLEY